jgi:hypothetical protein
LLRSQTFFGLAGSVEVLAAAFCKALLTSFAESVVVAGCGGGFLCFFWAKTAVVVANKTIAVTKYFFIISLVGDFYRALWLTNVSSLGLIKG